MEFFFFFKECLIHQKKRKKKNYISVLKISYDFKNDFSLSDRSAEFKYMIRLI